MSLQAKIEAVIYAAEEPVTLLQLVSLFGAEAQAELERQDRMQGQLQLETRADGPEPADAPESPDDRDDQEALNAEVMAAEADGAEAEISGELEETGAASSAVPVAKGSEEFGPEVAAAEDVQAGTSDAADRRAERERMRRVRELLRSLVENLVRSYADEGRGLEIREVAGGFRMATKPEYHDAVRGFARTLKPPLKLSLQALETLAVVAYKQPITAPEVAEIRGVDSGGVLGSLLGRKLVTTAGRKQVIGRPILYKTTKDFLLRFGLKDIAELPSIEEFEKMAGELTQEEISMTADEAGTFGVESPGLTEPGSDQVGTRDGGGSIDAPSGESMPAQGGTTLPQPDGDSGETESVDDVEPVDGRLSGIDPPDFEPGGDPDIDSPAHDAEVQSAERSGS